MITYCGNKCTANQWAKLMVCERGTQFYYNETFEYQEIEDNLTEKEKQDIEDAISKQMERVEQFFNYNELFRKIQLN